MGLVNLPRIPNNTPPEQAFNIINQALEEVAYRLSGFLQSDNIQEVGGWRVGQTELESKDRDVGMSTTDTAWDDVRFWAGSSSPDTAPWRVHKSGKAYMTGAHIQSSNDYPRVVVDPTSTLVGAYTSPSDYIAMQAQTTLGFTFPYLEFTYAGAYTTYLFQDPTKFGIQSNTGIDLYAVGAVTINELQVPSWGDLTDVTGATMQSALDNAGSSALALAASAHNRIDNVIDQISYLWSAISGLSSRVSALESAG